MGRLAIAQVVGNATDTVWSQVAVWPATLVQGEAEIRKQGLIMVAVTVETENPEAGEIGRSFLELLEQQLGATSEAEEMTQGVRGVVEATNGIQSVLVLRWRDQELNVVGFGEGQAILRRGEKMGTIFRGEASTWKVVRGAYVQGDKLLMGTEGLVGEMSDGLIQEVLSYETANQAGEELVTQVHAAEDNSRAAGWIVQVLDITEVLPTDEDTVTPEETVVATTREAPGLTEEENPPGVGEPHVYLKEPFRRRKTALSVGLVLLGLLGMSVWVGVTPAPNQRCRLPTP